MPRPLTVESRKDVRPVPDHKPATHFVWTVQSNGVPQRKPGRVTVSRIAKAQGLTEKQARSKAADIAHKDADDFIKEQMTGGTKRSHTVESWLNYCFEEILAKEKDLDYAGKARDSVAHHLYPTLGKIKLRDLKTAQLIAWFKVICEEPQAAPIFNRAREIVGFKGAKILVWKTTDHIRQRLVQAFQAAIIHEELSFNPALALPIRAHERKAYLKDLKQRKRWLTVEEVKQLRTLSKGSLRGIILSISDNTGERAAEACGQHIDDFDPQTGYVQIVRKADVYGGPTRLQETDPKGDGIRVFVASPELLAYVGERERAEAARLGHEQSPYVSINRDRNPIDPNDASKDFKVFCESIGIDLPPGNSLHALRRTGGVLEYYTSSRRIYIRVRF